MFAPPPSNDESPTNSLILIIEDVPTVIRVIRAALKDRPLDLVAVADGRSGLEQAKALDPGLILLDLALPIMDGWEVLRRLREDPGTASIPVVIVTAHGDSETVARAREEGANGFISKPFQPAQLRRAVDEYLSITARS